MRSPHLNNIIPVHRLDFWQKRCKNSDNFYDYLEDDDIGSRLERKMRIDSSANAVLPFWLQLYGITQFLVVVIHTTVENLRFRKIKTLIPTQPI